ncbi:MAG: hypothetical protein HND52_18655 [Ignavibacteriae bacterium]|nr:hypothetical protein [Ignavibacteriota bacterium]NOG99985.1 hypothetical protein [Ignavibacteriota bacterium]
MKALLYLALVSSLIVFGCSEDDENMNNPPATSSLTLNINGLEDLGTSAMYEGWIIAPTPGANKPAADTPISTGTFSVNSSGQLSKTSFEIDTENLNSASTFVLTIEPVPDNDPAPSAVHILAGDFTANTAALTVGHGAALGDAFAAAAGKYILATPTNGANTNENSGIWFLDISSGTPAQGLQLPTLPNGWVYEGWTVINGTPVTTGTFTSTTMVDNADPYSSTQGGPPFPGEDFLVNAPSGLTFPTNIAGGTAVISIEPSPDNSPNPFTLKPLVGAIPANAVDHETYMMNLNLGSFPTGAATR